MLQMFWLTWCFMVESTQCGVNVTQDGQLDGSYFMIPFQGDAIVVASGPIYGGFVFLLQMIFNVFYILLICVFYANVVDNEATCDQFFIVTKETWREFCWIVVAFY